MKLINYKILTCSLLFAASIQSYGSTVFLTSGGSAASAEWETWTSASATVTTGLSQGAAGTTTTDGSLSFSTTEVTTDILVDYSAYAGLFSGGDRYYIGDGAFAWNVDASLSSAVEYVRVSYSLADAGAAFAFGPTLDVSATQIDTGSYTIAGAAIYYTDFQLDSAGTAFSVSFGDAVAPHSHRSMDAIFVEVFNSTAPLAVPEPGTYALLTGLLSLGFCAAKRRMKS